MKSTKKGSFSFYSIKGNKRSDAYDDWTKEKSYTNKKEIKINEEKINTIPIDLIVIFSYGEKFWFYQCMEFR